jgi:PTS system N-acetylglucosamine-specific IIC component
MTASVADAPSSAGKGSSAFAVLQRIGRSLMLPIAVLPAAGLLIRLGQDDIPGIGGTRIAQIIGSGGAALLDALPLLFAVGIAIGFARRADGSTALSAVVGYLVFDRVFTVVIDGQTVQGRPITMGVLGGILIGLVTAVLYQKFYRIKLPPYLAFFGGRRFVPIITAFTALVLGVLFGYVWPPVWEGIDWVGEQVLSSGWVGAGIFGFVNRLLIPLGLHHIPNTIVWQVIGDYNVDGKVVHGDYNRFLAGDPEAGTFMAGFYPVMMFGLPAAAVAMWQEARPEKRKMVGGIMLTAALTSIITGVTEPLEFAFLFVAPVLFLLHAVLTGVAMALAALLGATHGFAFSAGLIDYLLYYNKADKPWILLIIGAAYAVIYYVLFRAAIRIFDLKTPGREADETGSEFPSERHIPERPPAERAERRREGYGAH